MISVYVKNDIILSFKNGNFMMYPVIPLLDFDHNNVKRVFGVFLDPGEHVAIYPAGCEPSNDWHRDGPNHIHTDGRHWPLEYHRGTDPWQDREVRI